MKDKIKSLERRIQLLENNIIDVKFKKIRDNAKIPIKATDGSCAYDVFASTKEYRIRDIVQCRDPLRQLIIGLGVSIEYPEKYAMIFIPRSSIADTRLRFASSIGLIDSDHRGELISKFDILHTNDNYQYMREYKIGDRVGQIMLIKKYDINFIESELSDTKRGNGGYGSTGF